MSKVEIKHIEEVIGDWDSRDRIEIWVDGKSIGGGSYGGEPEDNTRSRDYSWVEDVIAELAKELGATVECTHEVDKDA